MESDDTRKGAATAPKTPADEAFERAKEKTGQRVASAAGAMEGFKERMEKEKISEKAKDAIHSAGQTTRDVAGTTVQEAAKTKDEIARKAKPGTEL